jgi:hypothetical protein
MPKNTTYKRDSHEIDKLYNEVEKLVNHPDPLKKLSVNAACKKVGLQPTVYYFRKRKEEALAGLPKKPPVSAGGISYRKKQDNPQPQQPANNAYSTRSSSGQNLKDHNELIKELRELESKINDIKIQIAENMLKNI